MTSELSKDNCYHLGHKATNITRSDTILGTKVPGQWTGRLVIADAHHVIVTVYGLQYRLNIPESRYSR